MINPTPFLLIALATVAGALIGGHRGAAIGFLASGILILLIDMSNTPRPRF